MAEMTTRERFQRMFEHRDADRVPILGGPWGTTLERWRREGMPEGVDFAEYFGLDQRVGVGGDVSPRYEEKVIEETDEYIIRLSSWGTTAKNWKHTSSTPHWISRTVVDRESWEAAKARMDMGRDRVDWDHLKKNYPTWRENDWWIHGGLFFGFDVTHAGIVGTEQLLIWMAEDPELVIDMFSTELDCSLLPVLKENGGYIFQEDHSIPDSVSLDDYRRIVELAKGLARY